MKLALLIVAVLACASLVSAATICEDLVTANTVANTTAPTQKEVVQNLVERAINGYENNGTVEVEGLVNNAKTQDFFNGVLPLIRPGTKNETYNGTRVPDFTTDTDAYNTLVASLTSYFGGALGCAQGGTTGFPAYTGSDMGTVHSEMPIGQAVFTAFNKQVLDAAETYGATAAQGDALSASLNSFGRQKHDDADAAKKQICNQEDCNCVAGLIKDDATKQCAAPGDSASTVSVSFVALAAAAVVALFGRQ